MDEQLRRYVDEGVPTDLTAWSNERLRQERAEHEAAEAAVSYARRVLQGRLDIVRAELERRQEAGVDQAASLLDRLPTLLAGDHVATRPGRARATSLEVPPAAETLVARVDADLGERTLARLADRDDRDVAELIDLLETHERELSTARRALFDRIDAMRDELAQRYKDGRATVADLLR